MEPGRKPTASDPWVQTGLSKRPVRRCEQVCAGVRARICLPRAGRDLCHDAQAKRLVTFPLLPNAVQLLWLPFVRLRHCARPACLRPNPSFPPPSPELQRPPRGPLVPRGQCCFQRVGRGCSRPPPRSAPFQLWGRVLPVLPPRGFRVSLSTSVALPHTAVWTRRPPPPPTPAPLLLLEAQAGKPRPEPGQRALRMEGTLPRGGLGWPP